MRLKLFAGLLALLFVVAALSSCPVMQANAAATGMTVVGLYSETSGSLASYRVGGKTVVIKVGDRIPADAEIVLTVDRDRVELIPANNPNTVYEVNGSAGVPLTKKVADILTGKPRQVSFPKPGAKDPKFAGKAVVKQYMGRQVFQPKKGWEWEDLKYGTVLTASASVNIIGINNTLIMVLPDGKESKVIGPLKFSVDNLLKGKNLYKYMNVTK